MKDFDKFLDEFKIQLNIYKNIGEYYKDSDMITIWYSINKSAIDEDIMKGPRILYNRTMVIRSIAGFSLNLIKKYNNSQLKIITKMNKK